MRGKKRVDKRLKEREREKRASVCGAVKAMTVTESWDRARQPQGSQIEWKPMGVWPSLGGH